MASAARGPRVVNERIEMVDIDTVEPHPRNPREGDIGAIVDSCERHGFFGTIVCQASTRRILAGNHRWKAAKAIGGIPRVPVAWVDCDDDEALRILLVDNRLSDIASYNTAALSDLLGELVPTPLGLSGTGYDGDDLDDLKRALGDLPGQSQAGGHDDVGDVDALRDKYGTALGQVWEVGPHRVACGDSTDAAVLARLMGGEPAACVWMDPPYGVDYRGGPDRDRDAILNDKPIEVEALLVAALPAIAAVVAPGAPFYIAAPGGPAGMGFRMAVVSAGWRYHQDLIWVKNQFVPGWSDYHHVHESVLYGWTPGYARSARSARGPAGRHESSRWYGDDSQTTVFYVDRPARSDEHPTMKPPALIVPMLHNSTREGAIVLDAFAGSGSTLVACDLARRVGRGVDIDPRYVAATIDRLAEMGHTPRLLDDDEAGRVP